MVVGVENDRAALAAASYREPALSDAEISQTISLARIALIIGIVFLHYGTFPNDAVPPEHGLDIAAHPLATAINSFVLFIFFAAVPLLSAISGWLFFSFETAPQAALTKRIKRRIGSLYLPLVFWNAVWLAVLLALFATAPHSPVFHELSYDFSQMKVWDYVNAIFAVSDNPIAYQFWFVRDLFVTVLVSPLLWRVLTRHPYAGALVLGCLWIAAVDLRIFFRPDVPFFFYLGGLLRTRRMLPAIGLRGTLALTAVYVGLTVLRTMLPELAGSSANLDHFPYPMMTRALRLVGILSCWSLFVHAARTRLGLSVARFSDVSFFLFAVHLPLIAFVKTLFWRWLPHETDGWMLLQYAATVSVTLALGLSAGCGLARISPAAFALMNGGRRGFAGTGRSLSPSATGARAFPKAGAAGQD